MNNDDEWISMDQVKKNINRAMELTVEVERCQELNVSGEESLADTGHDCSQMTNENDNG